MTPAYQWKKIELLSIRDFEQDCNDKMKETMRKYEAYKLEAILKKILL